MEAAALFTTVDAFVKSSAFRYGDKQSFQVPLTDTIGLPGRHNPIHYLAPYKAAMPKRVAVIGPGNGGLATQALLLGAEDVTVFEPRIAFHKALAAITAMMSDAKLKTFKVVETWPKGTEGPFDLVLWMDAFDTLGRPEMVLAFLNLLTPEGEMRVEVQHGTHVATSGSHNAWRPTPETWTKLLESYGASSTPGTAGRLGSTAFYTVKPPKAKVAPTPTAPPAPAADEQVPATPAKPESKRMPAAPAEQAEQPKADAPSATPAKVEDPAAAPPAVQQPNTGGKRGGKKS